MSRLRIPFVGLVLALVVLLFGSVALEENSGAIVAGNAPLVRAPMRDHPIASPAPKRQSVPAARGPRYWTSEEMATDLRESPSQRTGEGQATKRGGTVYLTFDDGPSRYTPAILKILRDTHSTATFFEVGFRQARYPWLAAQVRAQGSSIGNHTYDHLDLTALTPAQIRWQVVHGPRGRCMRPPFGATDPRVRSIVAQQGLREVLWTIDTNDWSRPGTAQIVKAATGPGVRAGSIVLLHDGGGDRSQTVAALPKIIKSLQQRGYVIRRIPGC
jgi:peptidoglycan-N-acetylglucosamine deacetylase